VDNAGIGSWLRRRERLSPDDVAVIDGDRRLTFAELSERANRAADVLRAAGVTRRDRVAFLGRNSHAFLEVLIGTTALGAIFVPLNWRLTAPELAWILDDAAARVLVRDADLGADRVDRDDVATGLVVTGGDDSEGRLAAASSAWVYRAVALDDPALIL
jgi:fatty-acyl-CoA synthase